MGRLPLAAGEAPAWLAEVAGLVVGATVVAYLAFRAGLVPIVGFLLAGVVIGPNQLGIIADRELVGAAAEVGVILLLFTIGRGPGLVPRRRPPAGADAEPAHR